jgi:hypothetical protein
VTAPAAAPRSRALAPSAWTALLALGGLFLACGTDVDLGGGSSDAGPIDAGPPGGQCAPCASPSGCVSGTCGQFAGDLFCGTPCSSAAQCTADETCTTVTATTGSTVKVCIPANGQCTPAPPPASADGGLLDHCGALNGPSVASACSACGKFSNDCQPNGCYGGYWCNESARDCTPPPKSCP